MSLFLSKGERQLWIYALLVYGSILSSLFFGRPLQNLLSSDDVQAAFFVAGMLLATLTVLLHGIKRQTSVQEWTLWIGLTTVYTMLIVRLGAAERSHLIEYSVLSIFILRAMTKRSPKRSTNGLIAFIVSTCLGILDESLQLFLPHRVFDYNDLFFNAGAALSAVLASLLIQWVRSKYRHQKENRTDS